MGSRMNVARHAGFRIGDIEGDRGRDVTGSARKVKLVNNRYVFQIYRQTVGSDLYRTIRNLDDPENTVGRDPGIEIMELVPQTEVPEVNSNLHKSAVGLGGCCSSSAVSGHRSHVVPLIHANVRYDNVIVTGIVSRCASGVTHGGKAMEIGDAVGISIETIKNRSNAWKELIEEPEWRDQITSGEGHRLHLKLARQRQTADHQNANHIDELRSVHHVTSFDQDFRRMVSAVLRNRGPAQADKSVGRSRWTIRLSGNMMPLPRGKVNKAFVLDGR